jgi:hypothetical protein
LFKTYSGLQEIVYQHQVSNKEFIIKEQLYLFSKPLVVKFAVASLPLAGKKLMALLLKVTVKHSYSTWLVSIPLKILA